jgi:curved DNA-binding protein CbpA
LEKYYDILGIPFGSNASKVKKAYYKLAKKYHPDVSKEIDAKEKFIAINEAYELLTNPDLASRIKNYGRKTKPSTSQQRKATYKAKEKAKMSAEEFREYRLNGFKKDKIKLMKMILSLIGLDLFIYYFLWKGNIPGTAGYKENLPNDFLAISAIPLGIITTYLTYTFFKLTSHQKYFNE